MAESSDGVPTKPIDDALRRLFDDEHRRHLVDQRRRRHWLSMQAAESQSLVDVLASLADRGVPVALRTTLGTIEQSPIEEVGSDYVALCIGPADLRLVATRAITSIRPDPGAPRAPTLVRNQHRSDLVGRLAELAYRRPRVMAMTPQDAAVGRLALATAEVIVLQSDEDEDLYLATDHLVEIDIR